MCEIFAIIIIGLLDSLREINMWSTVMYDTIVSITNFCILMRVFTFCLKNKKIDKSKRTRIFVVMYTMFLVEIILGLLYFKSSSSFVVDTLLIKTLTGASMIGTFALIKISDLKMVKDYGYVYLICELIDIATIFIIITINLMISPEYIHSHNEVVLNYMLLLIVSLITRRIIVYKLDFWYHKKVLLTKFDILIAQDRIEQIFTPLERKVADDYILYDCNFIMRKSFIRSATLNSIIRIFMRKLLAAGFNRASVIKYTAMFTACLMTNLMKRDMDFSVIPTFIITPLQFVKRSWAKAHKN